MLIVALVMSYCTQLVAGFLPYRPGFGPMAGLVVFAVNKVPLRWIFLKLLQFPLLNFIPAMPWMH
jgi:hypothetical protein